MLRISKILKKRLINKNKPKLLSKRRLNGSLNLISLLLNNLRYSEIKKKI